LLCEVPVTYNKHHDANMTNLNSPIAQMSRNLVESDNLMTSLALSFGKKFSSLALIFNSLLSMVCAIGILSGYYASQPHWKLYQPYLIDGSLFWAIILASIINIFPATTIGHVNTPRVWFHHYVYGFVVLILSVVFLMMFTSIPLVTLFTANITDVTINIGRFFLLGGLTLVIDDSPDISRRARFILSLVKAKVYRRRRLFHVIQGLMAFLSLYFFLCVSVWLTQNPQGVTFANLILVGTLLVTSLTAFGIVNRKIWLNIKPEKA